jgi:GLTT repeat (6 copies)
MDFKVKKDEFIENSLANCGTQKMKWFAFGIVPTGVVSIGVVPMGVVSIGIVPMGVISIGSVAMGAIAAGFVSMGLFTVGTVSMSLNQGHASNLQPAPAQSPNEHHHH